MKIILLIVFFLNVFISFSQTDINTIMMKSTFKLSGESSDNNANVYGTGFLVGVPGTNNDSLFYTILVTAKHVFDDMKGDSITFYARLKAKDTYKTIPLKLRIRNGNSNLYFSHNNQDVAVIPIEMPNNLDFGFIPIHYLANDSTLIKNEVNPGLRINCLGFPLVQNSNSAGFPILRSGFIASYPIVPSEKYPSFLYDVTVFKGNSGGPVYYAYQNELFSKGKFLTMGDWVSKEKFYILGLISAERISKKMLNSYYESFEINTQLYIAVVIHARYIEETIKLINLN
jgi:hypothetical protein